MAKAILKVTKSYKIGAAHTLARSRIVTHSNTDSFWIKTTLYETKNILFRKKY